MQLKRTGELLAVFAVAACLRAPITSLPPQVTSIRGDLGLSIPQFALLTAIPVLFFALAAPLPTSRFLRMLSPDVIVIGALGLLTASIVTRAGGNLPLLYVGTVGIGVSVATLNVVTPMLIRRDFGALVTRIMPFYIAVLAIFATVGAAASIVISDHTTGDWRGGSTIWALLALGAFLLWLPDLRERHAESDRNAVRPDWRGLLRSRTTWSISAYMATQSILFYVPVTWVPKMLQDVGFSKATAGAYLGLLLFSGFVFTLVIPLTVGRGHDQRAALLITSLLPLIGNLGLLLAPGTFTALWLILIGAGPPALHMDRLPRRVAGDCSACGRRRAGTGSTSCVPGVTWAPVGNSAARRVGCADHGSMRTAEAGTGGGWVWTG